MNEYFRESTNCSRLECYSKTDLNKITMKHLWSIILVVAFMTSCVMSFRTTKFSVDTIKLGDRKELVVEKFGNPFMVKSKEGYDELYYKEVVDVSSYTYILTTELVFEKGILIEINQSDEVPAGEIEIKQK